MACDLIAWVVMLAVQIRLVSSIAYVFTPSLFDIGGPLSVGAAIALPLIALIALLQAM